MQECEMKLLAKSGVNWGCHSSKLLVVKFKLQKEKKVALLAHKGHGFVTLEVT